ncbi:MAG: hypothetical protein ACOYOK_05555 [Pseudobdellovibrionaceae bacterium]|jgi:hypothetical protein
MNEYEKLIEKILAHFVKDDFKDELQKAKNDFFAFSGGLDETAENFESRMSQFYAWYFFSRELSNYGKTPLEAYPSIRELRFSSEETAKLETLKNNVHSIFEFIKVKNEDVYIKDLLANKKIIVKKSPWIFGFNQEELFQVRLIPDGDSYIFARGFCFHPENAKKYILGEVKKYRKDQDLDPEVLLLKLIRMRYKFEQYRHVSAEQIYSNDSRLYGKE